MTKNVEKIGRIQLFFWINELQGGLWEVEVAGEGWKQGD